MPETLLSSLYLTLFNIHNHPELHTYGLKKKPKNGDSVILNNFSKIRIAVYIETKHQNYIVYTKAFVLTVIAYF